MKRYLLPSALILAFGLALAGAQTITKSIQLTQDPRSPIGMDANNGVYFPQHVLTVGPATAPALTSCGSGSPTIVGTDTGGVITAGTTATGCTATFNVAYLAAPYCVVSSNNPASPVGATTSTTALTITNSSNSGMIYSYFCTGLK